MSELFELLTLTTQLQLNVKLPIEIEAEKLLSDFQAVSSRFSGQLHSIKEHHDGGWKSIGLVTSGGKVEEDRHMN
ncbi:MAG: hypothetical protein ACFCAD_13730 [Pleurocapsa sp.]